MSRIDEINDILRFMQSGTPDVEGCAIVSDDGLLMASALPAHVDEKRIAGMTATLLGLGGQTATELGRGTLEQVYLRGANGYLIATQAAEGTVLVVLTNRNAKLGLIFLDMRRCIDQICKVL